MLIIESPEDQAKLQEDLDSLTAWQDRWQLRFNAKKCYLMHMTRSKSPARYSYKLWGVTLGEVTSNPYLGVQIQADLGSNTHIDYATGKASRILGLIKRNLNINNTNLKLTAFNILVRPILEYGACAWDPHTKKNIKKIEAVQRNAARFILSNYERTPGTVTGLLKELNMVSLEQRKSGCVYK